LGRINVKVVPGSSRDRVVGPYGDGIKVQVSAPPEGGKANRAVVELIAGALGVRSQQVQVVKGHTQPRKLIDVVGMADCEIREKLSRSDTGAESP
jgi:uncharacterized protein (TIGR00251 family)